MTALYFANLFFAGILAGMEIAIHYGVGKPPVALNDESQILLRQALVLKLRVLVPAFFVPTALSEVAIVVFSRASPAFRLWCAGLLTLAVWIGARVIATVPINSATLTWNAAAPPHNWKALVDRAESFHIAGVWAAAVAFALSLAAVAVTLKN